MRKDPDAPEQRGGPRVLNFDATSALLALAKEHPQLDATSLASQMLMQHNVVISNSTVYATLERSCWTRKCIESRAKEADPEQETAYILDMQHYSLDQFIFLDKVHFDERNLNVMWGWGPKGKHVIMDGNFRHENRFTTRRASRMQLRHSSTRLFPPPTTHEPSAGTQDV